jgi:hypothetical protein
MYKELMARMVNGTYEPKDVEEYVDIYMNTFLENDKTLKLVLRADLMFIFSNKHGYGYSKSVIKSAINVWDYLNVVQPINNNAVDRWIDSKATWNNTLKGRLAKELYDDWSRWAYENNVKLLDFRTDWFSAFRANPRVLKSQRQSHWGYRYFIIDKQNPTDKTLIQ